MLNRDANLLRDLRRRLELAQEFRELEGAERLETALFSRCQIGRQRELAEKRDYYRRNKREVRARARAKYAELKADPVAYAAWLKLHAARVAQSRARLNADPAEARKRREATNARNRELRALKRARPASEAP